jgi:tetratricopeptide (TPR) repeat protein
VSTLSDRYAPMIERDRQRALDELNDLVGREPSAEALQLLARAHQRCLDFRSCAATAEKLVALTPQDTEAWLTLAFAQQSLNAYEVALETYRRAHSVSRAATSGYWIAVLLHRLGRLDEAARAFEALLAGLAVESDLMSAVLRAAMSLARDRGRALEADRLAGELIRRFNRRPVNTSSYLVSRDQAAAFPEWIGLAEKSALGDVLARGRAAEPEGARFPETFDLPRQRDALLAFAAAAPAGTLYIAKPARGSGGQGIRVVGEAAAVADEAGVVVQRYVDRPYLIDGRKGHLRIYALITSVQPLRAYVYDEGIVRFAPEPYDLRPERLGDISMHVTNTALHEGRADLVISEDPNVEDAGAIWSLSAVLKRIAADGRDPAGVMAEIRALVAWFLRQVEREGLFARQAARGPARSFAPKLIGFDILLDADARPWLIEIQTSPAASGAALVNRINGELFTTVFRMGVGVLAEDGMAPERIAALMRDPATLAARELEIETGNAGRFVRI